MPRRGLISRGSTPGGSAYSPRSRSCTSACNRVWLTARKPWAPVPGQRRRGAAMFSKRRATAFDSRGLAPWGAAPRVASRRDAAKRRCPARAPIAASDALGAVPVDGEGRCTRAAFPTTLARILALEAPPSANARSPARMRAPPARMRAHGVQATDTFLPDTGRRVGGMLMKRLTTPAALGGATARRLLRSTSA
jgi:hypothetical protein